MKKLLFLSNGHGEDQTAARIIKELGDNFDISAYPLVGEGFEFSRLNVKLLDPRKPMPSGGFSLRNMLTLPKDIANGLFGLYWSQYKKLKELKNQFDIVIAIGDLVPLAGAILTSCPFFFVGVNKSDYYHSFGLSYTPWEIWLLKKYAKKVFARDEITANNLKSKGINASYVGNPLMDGITPSVPSGHLPLHKGEIREGVIGFLPGTRKDDIEKNIEDFEMIKNELLKLDKNLQFQTAAKPTRFEDVIYNADVIVGLSGTGNEQAAGIGKPVVAFAGRGAQYNKKFAKAQKELLGEALALVNRNPKIVANEVWQILNDPARSNYMGEIGKARMGKPGAISKIAKETISFLS